MVKFGAIKCIIYNFIDSIFYFPLILFKNIKLQFSQIHFISMKYDQKFYNEKKNDFIL